jgi:hypothetical protein
VRWLMIPLMVSIRRICADSSAGRPECRRKSSERENRARPNDFSFQEIFRNFEI